MARAGYDPREMANMFKTIEAKGGGSGGPEWLSDHPNPGNRYNAITKEASTLRVGRKANTGEFPSIQARLRDMSPAYTAEQIARRQARGENGRPSALPAERSRLLAFRQHRTYEAGNFLRISVPANWLGKRHQQSDAVGVQKIHEDVQHAPDVGQQEQAVQVSLLALAAAIEQ